jgi:hypothetical protein|nr:MAG TPA: hypothetical protein [Caudoviricetes sp.]
MLKMVDGTGIIGVDMICPLGISTPQPPNYDKVELEGAGMLVLPNSLDAPLERLELGGKTDQFSTKGLNLFNYKDFVDISTYADEGAGYRRKYLQLKPNTSYRMTIFKNRMSPSMDATVMFIGNKEKYDNTAANGKIVLFTSTDKKSATIVTGESGQIVFKLNKNSTPELQEEYLSKADIILSEGSTEIPYEPYTGGKPSPSPEYPQEIKSVGKWNEEKQKYEVDVKVVGKNLFDVNYFAESENYQNKEGDATYWKYATFKVKPNTTYTVSKRKSLNVNGAINNGIYYGGALAFNNDVNSVKITTKDDGVFYVIFFYRSEDVNILKEMDIQIELGETLTEYEPYKEQTLTLTSDRPITKWDRLVEQDGQIGWLYNSVNETIDGKTGKWSIQPASKIFYRTDITFPIAVPFCSELLGYDYSSVGYKKDTGITINNLGILCITLPEEVELTLDAYKQYLADNPLHVLYKGDSEEFVPLPQSEQNAIRALKTYYPTTVITVDGGELDPDIKVTYRKEK